ncbi:MAG TPA: hypothetical protein P5539_15515 [Mesotoga sp.]|jgi:hypothetical protein|nr:hypothetical protein [Mesotoga sp.]
MPKVQLAGRDVFYKDSVSGISLSRFAANQTVAELPPETMVEIFDVNRRQLRTVSNWSVILEDIKNGILKFVDEKVDQAPAIETATPINKEDSAETLRRATEFLDGSITVVKHRLTNIFRNDILDAMLMIEKSKPNARKTVLDAIKKRKNHPKVAGPGLVTSEPSFTVNLSLPSGV